MRAEVAGALQNILDTMTGADGGLRFLRVKAFLEDFDNRASKGDDDAQKIVDVAIHFSRIIDIATKGASTL